MNDKWQPYIFLPATSRIKTDVLLFGSSISRVKLNISALALFCGDAFQEIFVLNLLPFLFNRMR